MKNTSRLIFTATVIACIAALGFNHGAWAGPLSAGTVPSCTTTITSGPNTTQVLCHEDVVVTGLPKKFTVTSTEVDLTPYGFPPHATSGGGVLVTFQNQNGHAVSAGLVKICFPAPGGFGVIYRYWTKGDWNTHFKSNESSRWVVSPTFFENGMACTMSWLPGIYTLVY